MHNLKNIEVDIPHNKLVVVTGLSGSGKSTLAFDTIFAEGQRRYVESLSAYARQFLGRIGKPDVDYISGIAPAIAVEQKVNTRNPRSTVGTTTEIYNYLELLFARIGHTFSPVSGQEVRCYDTDDIAEYIASLGNGVRVIIAVPMQLKEGQGLIEKLTLLLADGIRRIYRNGAIELIEDFLPAIDDTTSADDIDIVINRILTDSDDDDTMSRIRESVSRALGYGTHSCVIISEVGRREFSTQFEADGICFGHPTEHLFSFNNPIGACPRCEGYGRVVGIDENLVVPDKSKSIFDNAIACWRGDTMRWFRDQLVANAYKFDFPIHEPYYKL
ncbi:MAG: excinuclease ABC subunit A, partial [Alistipes sp.]